MAFPFPDFRHDPVANALKDIHSALTDHDPLSELQRGLDQADFSQNVFSDVLDDTYGRNADYRNCWTKTSPVQDDFSIDYRQDRLQVNQTTEYHRTSRELMMTLGSYSGEINTGRYSDYITRDELKNFLVRSGDRLDPQEKTDLLQVMRDFDRIARADGKDGKGISYRDMAMYVIESQGNDRMIMICRENEKLRETNARLREQLHDRNAAPKESGRVITQPNGDRGHFYASGSDLPLSQEEFKAHYGIPKNIDLLKFMPGKANDGQVPDFWTSDVAAGLGGRDGEDLRWNNASHHDLALDFQRNFAQLAHYFDKLPLDQQMEFTFNFARTQSDVMRSHGVAFLAADNEKIQINVGGATKYVDLVQDVNSDHKLLQWLV